MAAWVARRAFQTATVLLVAACTHTDPFATDPPDSLGPADPGIPRQLTYNLGDDRTPNVAGGQVVFSRRDPSVPAPGPCLAVLPVEGGSLSTLRCPPPPSAQDTFVSGWLEPALSPDSQRVAFVWRRSTRTSTLAAWSYDLVVAAVDSPTVPLASVGLPAVLPGNRVVNTAAELAWVTPDIVRFLAAYDSIIKVKSGTAARATDTISVPRALMEFTVSTGTLAMIPGGDDVRAWAPAPDGGLWVVPESDRLALAHLATDGTRTPVGTWPLEISDLASDGALVLALGAFADSLGPVDTLYWMDPAAATVGRMPLSGAARRLSPAGVGQLVLEIERRPGDGFGAPANLWLVAVPAP